MEMKIAAICQANHPRIYSLLYVVLFFGTNVCRRKEKNGTKKTFTQMYMSISIRKKNDDDGEKKMFF